MGKTEFYKETIQLLVPKIYVIILVKGFYPLCVEEFAMKDDIKLECIAGIYKDIAERIDVETAYSMYKYFNGLQITFPKKFYNMDYIKVQILEKYNQGESIKELSREYQYSERWIRKIVKDVDNCPKG
jgi:Mor family transcriptional regulator